MHVMRPSEAIPRARQALRTETTINDTRDFSVGRRLRTPPAGDRFTPTDVSRLQQSPTHIGEAPSQVRHRDPSGRAPACASRPGARL